MANRDPERRQLLPRSQHRRTRDLEAVVAERPDEAELARLLERLRIERTAEPLLEVVDRPHLGLLLDERSEQRAAKVEHLLPGAVRGLDQPLDRLEVEALGLHL